MKTENVEKIIDKISDKLGIATTQLIEAYEGEAKVRATTYWIYLVLGFVLTIIGTVMSFIALGLKEGVVERTYSWYNVTSSSTELSTGGVILLWFGIVVAGIGVISLVVQIFSVEDYLIAKKAPKTYAINKIMSTIFDK